MYSANEKDMKKQSLISAAKAVFIFENFAWIVAKFR